VLSLVLTLVAIPVIYSLFDDLARLRIRSRSVAAVRTLWAGLIAALPARRAPAPAPEYEHEMQEAGVGMESVRDADESGPRVADERR
jgi:hypothetical protein